MKAKITPYLENVAEAGCACLITMVQGNLLTLGVTHWIIASQTGLIAGAIAGTTILAARLRKRWVISLMLGTVTAAVDFFVHPGAFGAMAVGEALVTGLGAALLSYGASLAFMLKRRPQLRAAPLRAHLDRTVRR